MRAWRGSSPALASAFSPADGTARPPFIVALTFNVTLTF